jgi:predicted glutamine amidotransferase
MCELLGLAFNKPITPGLSFRGFRHRARPNRHGWGLAAITPTGARITKEPLPADRSGAAESLRDDPTLTAPIFIGHVRLASCGDVRLENTHPFTRRVRGRDFVFAHNGTLDKGRLKARPAAEFPVEGSTDSEQAMCVLLSWMARERVDDRDYALVERFLRELNGAGTMNLLFSDGKRLFCYRDTAGSNGLCGTHREAPFCHVRLRDEDWEADLPEEKAPNQKGFVIASHALTEGEEWHDFTPGSLSVFERGEIVFGAWG